MKMIKSEYSYTNEFLIYGNSKKCSLKIWFGRCQWTHLIYNLDSPCFGLLRQKEILRVPICFLLCKCVLNDNILVNILVHYLCTKFGFTPWLVDIYLKYVRSLSYWVREILDSSLIFEHPFNCIFVLKRRAGRKWWRYFYSIWTHRWCLRCAADILKLW